MSEALSLTRDWVATLMDEIAVPFQPGAKITVMVRTPDFPDRDFLMTNDTFAELHEMLARSSDREATS